MKSTSQEKAIPFKDALRIFWDWRQASVSVEVCFFYRPGSSENVRVSIDGVVRLVDSEGIVTVSGDGREMDLDLRGSEITHAREVADGVKSLNPLDPDSILKVKFPNGEICLIFPYRRVGYPLAGQRPPETGPEWMQNALSRSAKQNRRPAKLPAGLFSTPMLEPRSTKTPRLKTSKTGPPLFPMTAFLLVFVLIALALTPSSIPKLLVELGVRQKMSDPGALVWVIPQDGNYYCSGSMLNGREPGRLMKQEDALMHGYQPAVGHYCQSGDAATTDDRLDGFRGYFQTVR